MLAKMALKPEEVSGITYDMLTDAERKAVADWVHFAVCVNYLELPAIVRPFSVRGWMHQVTRLRAKYTIVGFLTDGCHPRSIKTDSL
jgi:hypothetical protein